MAKVLMIATQEILSDLSDGGKKVSNRNYRLLCDVFGKENVFLVMCTNDRERKQDHLLRVKAYGNAIDRIINILSGRISMSQSSEKQILNLIKERLFNIVFLDRTIQGRLACKIKKNNPNIQIWSFSHNIEHNYFRNKFKNNALISLLIGNIIGRSEKAQMNKTNHLFVLTARDRNLNKEKYGIDSIIIPTSFEDKFRFERIKHESNDFPKHLLFIGSMFGPNYDGIKWFIDNVMPELEEYNLTVVGKNFESKRTELQRKNVEVIGGVDNLEEYYYGQNIMVIPIFYGDGQKVKTAEAMMYGKVIMATDEALEGYEVDNVNGIFRCNTKEEFINNIKNVNESKLDEYMRSVRETFNMNYNYCEIVKRITPIMKGLLYTKEINNKVQ